MSEINCAACEELRNSAPEFVAQGVTEKVCLSLQNNTGLNPDLVVLHRNGEDLHNANDCLIARMNHDVLSVEVCDWKEFMQRFIPNLYELQKALICDSTGIWIKIDDLYIKIKDIEDRIDVVEDKVGKIPGDFDPSQYAKKSELPDLSEYALKSEIPDVDPQQVQKNTEDVEELNDQYYDLCELLNQTLTQNPDAYGTLTGSRFVDDTDKKGGTIASTPSGDALIKGQETGFNRVGVYYVKRQFRNCEGIVKTYEWIQPTIAFYNLGASVTNYDQTLWTVDLSVCRQWGMTDALLNWLRDYPQWWGGYGNSEGLRTDITLSLTVESGALTMRLKGSTGALNENYIDSDTYSPKLVVS